MCIYMYNSRHPGIEKIQTFSLNWEMIKHPIFYLLQDDYMYVTYCMYIVYIDTPFWVAITVSTETLSKTVKRCEE